MPPLPSDWLRDRGLVEFTSSATAATWSYARAWAEGRSERADLEDSFRAFVELGAIEFALVPFYRGSFTAGGYQILEDVPPVDRIFPVVVSNDAVADAIYKTDCGPFSEHLWKESSELRPWDVFAFAGDMSKLELLNVPPDINQLADHRFMDATIAALADRYAKAGVSSRVVESGLLGIQGIIWSAKLAVLRGEDYTEINDLEFATRYLPEIA